MTCKQQINLGAARWEESALHLVKNSESGRSINCRVLTAEIDGEGNHHEKWLSLTCRESGAACSSLVAEIGPDGQPHYGEGHDANSAAALLWEVVLATLPDGDRKQLGATVATTEKISIRGTQGVNRDLLRNRDLLLVQSEGNLIVRAGLDGSVEFGDGYSPEEAAEALWRYIPIAHRRQVEQWCEVNGYTLTKDAGADGDS